MAKRKPLTISAMGEMPKRREAPGRGGFLRASASLRGLRGTFTLRQVAAASGVDPATLHRAEAGLEPGLLTAIRLSRFYETTLEDIWGRDVSR